MQFLSSFRRDLYNLLNSVQVVIKLQFIFIFQFIFLELYENGLLVFGVKYTEIAVIG